MFATDDTIAAIATPPGHGGLGVVRLSGPRARAIATTLTGRDFADRRATLAAVRDAQGTRIDRAVVTYFRGPHSYTGEDVVEVSAHGSPVLLQAILKAMLAAGARLASPGEFTFRAHLNGRIDLIQAEAVRDLVEAVTPLQARAALDQLEGTLTRHIGALDAVLLDVVARLEASLDFPDEGYHFITPQEAGESLARVATDVAELLAAVGARPPDSRGVDGGDRRAPERGKIQPVQHPRRRAAGDRHRDTGDDAGSADGSGRHLRRASDDRRHGGGARARRGRRRTGRDRPRAKQALEAADLVVVVLDSSQPLRDEDAWLLAATEAKRRVVVAAKSDLAPAWQAVAHGALPVSSLTDAGLDQLRAELSAGVDVESLRDRPAIANVRQGAALARVETCVARAAASAAAGAPEECVAADLHEARLASGRADRRAPSRPGHRHNFCPLLYW